MALTKVRLPVADIAAISNGTSNVTIGSAGGDIVITRGGVTHTTVDTGGLLLGTGLYLYADELQSETVSLATAAGAEATIATSLTKLSIATTSAHPVEIGANSITALTIATDGKVTLGVEGTAAGHLITKAYADAIAAAAPTLAAMTFNVTSPGSLQIPANGNTFILNWGITASLTASAESVTFNTSFPNAVLGAFATRIAPASREDRAGVNNVTTSGMDVVQSGGNASQVYWMAFGY